MGMSNVPLPWGEDAPETLTQLCVKNIVENPDSFCDRYVEEGLWVLKCGLSLPQEICERIVESRQEAGPEQLNNEFVGMFEDLSTTRLKRAIVRNSSLSDEGLNILLKHDLTELDISNCKNLTETTINNINIHGEYLKSVTLCNNIFRFIDKEFSNDEDEPLKHMKERGYVLNTPNLVKLVLHDLHPLEQQDFFPLLLKPLQNILYLDISGCKFLGNLWYTTHITNLRSLIIHGIHTIKEALPTICTMKNLRLLDISQVNSEHGEFEKPDEMLNQIIQSLPHLTHLDISGTNLPGRGTFDIKTKQELEDLGLDDAYCDIPGLQSRVKNPLEFLGLYNTHHNACQRYSIPAIVIAGEANEEQVLAATEAYIDRPGMLIKALNELFHIFRYEHCLNQTKALKLILYAMMRHQSEKHIQISGSASLFYITKNEKSKLSSFARRKMISVLLDAMEKHIDDSTMMRNGCLTFCQFRMPEDMICSYRRLVNILLKLVKGQHPVDDFVRRIAIFILNTLACQVDGQHKELVGDLGAIETLLCLINDRLSQNNHDDVLDIAWSAMWNVTDETPINCQRFLDGQGMTYFLKCLKKFPDKEELLRNMMGLLGNVAEVEYLRPRLVTSTLISTFTRLLDSDSDGIEVSYNAAGVLSHIMSDGPSTWSIHSPSREDVLLKIVEAIKRWDLKSKRNINYRSFEPILRLLQVKHTPECQEWAAWALANLTSVYPNKYCSLLEEEDGLAILNDVISTSTCEGITKLAKLVVKHCKNYKKPSSTHGSGCTCLWHSENCPEP